jgi:glycosyltransferase involved in cell wall biosynthesis
MPVIAATDPNTDIGDVIQKNICGFKVISGDNEAMQMAISNIVSNEEQFNIMKENAWNLLQKEYLVERSYKLIKEKVNV